MLSEKMLMAFSYTLITNTTRLWSSLSLNNNLKNRDSKQCKQLSLNCLINHTSPKDLVSSMSIEFTQLNSNSTCLQICSLSTMICSTQQETWSSSSFQCKSTYIFFDQHLLGTRLTTLRLWLLICFNHWNRFYIKPSWSTSIIQVMMTKNLKLRNPKLGTTEEEWKLINSNSSFYSLKWWAKLMPYATLKVSISSLIFCRELPIHAQSNSWLLRKLS